VAGYVLQPGEKGKGPSGPGRGKSITYKKVLSLLDDEPLFGERELRFYRWIADYYLAPIGEVLRAALPVSMHQRSYKAIQILPQGLVSLQEGVFLSKQELNLLALLERRGKVTFRDLHAKMGETADRVIQSLEAKGYVEKCQLFQGRTIRHSEGDFASNPEVPATGSQVPTLTEAQDTAVRAIVSGLDQKNTFHPFLLHGITGSGKTEVYLRVIEASLRMGREALVLVPEIALTPQTVQRFSERFGPVIAVHHSRLTERERLDGWWRVRRGQVKIVIGARSAVFAPFRNLGVIVVDEEHDPSYKQQDRLRYNGRDLSLVRGKLEQSVVILGSATPSLESYFNAQKGKSTLLELPERIAKLAKQLLGPLAGDPLDHVGELLAAVVAPARVALRVLVGEDRAQRGEHLGEGVVLGGNQLDALALAILLADEGLEELRVVLGEKLAVAVHGRS